jgi:hypothetical protein
MMAEMLNGKLGKTPVVLTGIVLLSTGAGVGVGIIDEVLVAFDSIVELSTGVVVLRYVEL